MGGKRFKLAVFTDEVSQDFGRAVDFAKEFGLDGIEIRSVWNKPPHKLDPDDVRRMRSILKGTNLAVASIASPFFKCELDSAREREEHMDILHRSAELGRAFDCRLVRGFAFWRRKDLGAVKRRIVEIFAEEVIGAAEKEDIILGIENEASTYLGRCDEVADFLGNFDSPHVAAIYDPANSLQAAPKEIPYPDGYEALKGRIAHFHLKDAAPNPEDTQVVNVPVGEGEVDFAGLFRAMIADGYTGFASLETHWRPKRPISGRMQETPGGREFSDTAEEASHICMARLKEILAGL